MNFLRKRNIAVPGRISIIGFDNTTDALDRGLTTIDFDMPHIMVSMINYCIRRKTGVAVPRQSAVEMPCYCVERSTTRRLH